MLFDKDGTAYLYTSMGRFSVAKLKSNMVELDSRPQTIGNLPTAGLIEGPFAFERNGIYYLAYPHVPEHDGATRVRNGQQSLGAVYAKGSHHG